MFRWFSHPLALIVVTVLSLWVYVSLSRTEQKMRRSTESVAVLDQEVKEIASEVSEFELFVQQATAPAAQETIIRNELLMKKPGEYVVQLPEIEKQANPEENYSETSPWQNWRSLLNI